MALNKNNDGTSDYKNPLELYNYCETEVNDSRPEGPDKMNHNFLRKFYDEKFYGTSNKNTSTNQTNMSKTDDNDSTSFSVAFYFESLVELINTWESSKNNMIKAIEDLYESKLPDSYKINALNYHVKKFKTELNQNEASKLLKETIESEKIQSKIQVPIQVLSLLWKSLVKNYQLECEKKESDDVYINDISTIKEEKMINKHISNSKQLVSFSNKTKSNYVEDFRHFRTDQIENPFLICKLGNYWSRIDDNSHLMISRLVNGTLSQREIVSFLSTQLQGRYNIIKTSFGDKLRLYADYTASGQELVFFTNTFESILENYSNTHTEASYDGRFMNQLLHEAELKILKGCNADPKTHTVISTGTGATGAIEMVQKIIGTYIPPRTIKTIEGVYSWKNIKDKLRKKKELPLVIVTPYEHHSNEITWRNQLCDIDSLKLGADGFIDFKTLKIKLKNATKKYKKIICSFSAASNVTGIKTDIDMAINTAKKYNAIVCLDYAGCGPYTCIDMSKEIDAIYLSPHKFIGGPGASGIAIIKNWIYDKTLAPTHGGGGTVDFVNQNEVIYSSDISTREKSGTPGVVQIIRTGLIFDIKNRISNYIEKREVELLTKFFQRFGKDPRLFIFGPIDPVKRISIVSFNIKHIEPKGERYLHPIYVIRLLSDLFGIQGRGGCSCAGPYGHELLKINPIHSQRLKEWITPHNNPDIGYEGIKFGWARINLHYCLSDEEIEYIMDAIDFIADYGHLLLPFYVFDPITGTWQHIDDEVNYHEILSFKLIKTPKLYAKNEQARIELFKKQLNDAKKMVNKLNKSFSVDAISQWGDLVQFYAAKGSIKFKENIIKT